LIYLCSYYISLVQAIPGRIIPVDLAPITSRAPTADAAGYLIDVPCGTPEHKPELFNVQGLTEDRGPICETYPCQLEIRGRNFFANATVILAVPDEQRTQGTFDGPYGGRTPEGPNVTVGEVMHIAMDEDIYSYDNVSCESLYDCLRDVEAKIFYSLLLCSLANPGDDRNCRPRYRTLLRYVYTGADQYFRTDVAHWYFDSPPRSKLHSKSLRHGRLQCHLHDRTRSSSN
jgi:hypothetical protein